MNVINRQKMYFTNQEIISLSLNQKFWEILNQEIISLCLILIKNCEKSGLPLFYLY